jgi:hypothetical protein
MRAILIRSVINDLLNAIQSCDWDHLHCTSKDRLSNFSINSNTHKLFSNSLNLHNFDHINNVDLLNVWDVLLRETDQLVKTLPESDQCEVLDSLLVETGNSINFCLESYHIIYPSCSNLPLNLRFNFESTDLINLEAYMRRFVNEDNIN